VRASVFAVFDARGGLRFVGQSRDVQQSLRMMLGRRPAETHQVAVHHIEKPSRDLLDTVRRAWIEEAGGEVPGNDGGAEQALWEQALDVNKLMTEEDRQSVVDGRNISKLKEESAIKAICRR
jgi:hypothetical protein